MTLPDDLVAQALAELRRSAGETERRYPGDGGARQPIHVMYGGAHLFTPGAVRKLGDRARRILDEHAPDGATFAEALGIDPALGDIVRARVAAKLEREPIEDFRIDFEDGYGVRSDEEEDSHADGAVEAVAAGDLPPFLGIRVKPLTPEQAARSIRTLDRFVTALVARSGLPAGFTVTLPKIVAPEQVAVLARLLGALEERLGLAAGVLTLELMVETTQSANEGMLPRLVAAAAGRCRGAHFGVYDYTAACDIAASEQRMRHPACDFARQTMKVALSGTGVWLSDGATTILPVGDRTAVHAAWRLHADDIRHSLASGFYQGWDLHPAQLPSRYGAVYGFFLEGLAAASERLRRFVAQAAQATRAGGTFDDAATGQGLLNFFLRGLSCGALTEEEAAATGLTIEELRTRSFAAILAARRRPTPGT